MLLIYPKRKEVDGKEENVVRAFFLALKHLPADLVEKSFTAHMRRVPKKGEKVWFPTPNEIVEGCQSEAAHRVRQIKQAEALLALPDAPTKDEPKPTMDELRAVMRKAGMKLKA